MPRETLKFIEKTERSGTSKTGKPYTIYSLKAEDGRKFSTFNADIAKTGVEQEVTYTETPKSFTNEQGKLINYTQRDIVSEEQTTTTVDNPTTAQPRQGGETLLTYTEVWRQINEKLDRILKSQRLIYQKLTSEDIDEDETTRQMEEKE